MIDADGSAATETGAEPDEEQPVAATTATERVAAELVPADHKIAGVPAPAVIVPPVTVHEYVAPAPASGTLAAFPAEEAQTLVGAVITDDGALLTAVFAEPESLQPPADVTATETVVVPETPAVKVMLRDPAPEVSVPLTMDHEYVAPSPASGTDATPAAPAQSTPGAATAAEGIELIAIGTFDVASQPSAVVTVTARVVLPAGPAVKEISRDP